VDKNSIHITILGGGPAGLAAGYYAKKNGIPFTIYEASGRTGGNAITLEHGDFRFDSGAHRFHDKDREVTGEIKNLLGEDLKKISVPSTIFHNERFIDFPLSPLDLLIKLGLVTFTRAGFELIITRIRNRGYNGNFRSFAVNTYGKTVSELFLLNYSEKLWGMPCDKLSPYISGKRMKGLNLRTFLKESVMGKKAKTEHLDGSFYYPENGFGTIAERLADFCGAGNIHGNSRVTGVFHDHERIRAVEINNENTVPVDHVVSTLALPHFIKLMDPPPGKEILSLIETLRFRSMIVVAFFINKDSITDNGSIYFPSIRFPFTRVYEPKNRSRSMSPPGKTSLCVEIPCFTHGTFWNMQEKELLELISSYFIKLNWFGKEDIFDSKVIKLEYAYPVLEKDCEEKVEKVFTFLKNFHNLRVSGRNGRFMYTHVHDMMRFGKEVIGGISLRNGQ
jgi:protoporphyrinogen oxidase